MVLAQHPEAQTRPCATTATSTRSSRRRSASTRFSGSPTASRPGRSRSAMVSPSRVARYCASTTLRSTASASRILTASTLAVGDTFRARRQPHPVRGRLQPLVSGVAAGADHHAGRRPRDAEALRAVHIGIPHPLDAEPRALPARAARRLPPSRHAPLAYLWLRDRWEDLTRSVVQLVLGTYMVRDARRQRLCQRHFDVRERDPGAVEHLPTAADGP